jgi:hypothetical protein
MDEDVFWGERNPQETEALKSLVDAEACLGEAMVSGAIELYSDALEFSEKVIECFPQCALAHYFAGFAWFKAKGDKDYARKKCEILQSIESEEANTLAQRLKAEIE